MYYSFNIFSLLSLFAALVNLLVGFVVFFKNPKNSSNRLLFFCFFAAAMWGLGEGMQRASTNPQTALFWDSWFTGFGSNFFAAFLLHFWLLFSMETEKIKKKIFWLLYTPILVSFFLSVKGLVAVQDVQQYWGYESQGGSLSYWFSMFFIVLYGVFVIFLAFKKSAASSGKMKTQARNIALGVLFSLSTALATEVFRPIFHIDVPQLTIISTLILNLLIAFTVYKLGFSITPNVADIIFSTMDDYLVAVDRTLKVAVANNSLLKNLGFASTEMIGEPLNKFLTTDLAENNFRETQKKLPIINQESFLKMKNGGQIPVQVNASLLREEDGSPSGLVLVLRDARKLNQLFDSLKLKTQELEKSKIDLEKNVMELQRMNDFMVNRELKMIELKKKIEELENEKNVVKKK